MKVSDMGTDHGTPGLKFVEKLEGNVQLREKFPVVGAGEMDQILAAATRCQTNKMKSWGVQQFKPKKAKGPIQYPTKQHKM